MISCYSKQCKVGPFHTKRIQIILIPKGKCSFQTAPENKQKKKEDSLTCLLAYITLLCHEFMCNCVCASACAIH